MILAKNHPLKKLGIAWQLSEFHGWGVFGINIAKQMVEHELCEPILLSQDNIDSKNYPSLIKIKENWSKIKPQIDGTKNTLKINGLTVLHSFGNDFTATQKKINGDRNIGFIFFENPVFTVEGISRAQNLDMVIAGSRWNAELLKKMGLQKVAYVMQGVDSHRYAHTKNYKNDDYFVIFSGGKLEYRKGQDIVLESFRRFHKKYPNTKLLTAWNNPWPQITQDLSQSPYEFGVPLINNGHADIAEWCSRSGLPDTAFLHTGFTPNGKMTDIYFQADVGLFPNRAEGGTNLVAMELMSCGIPCIISANTGHNDLIAENTCAALTKQKLNNNQNQFQWGESDIDEIVDFLEKLYLDKLYRKKIGDTGRIFINQFDWQNQTRELVRSIADTY